MSAKLGFIGAGRIASSLISGLVSGGYPAHAIWVSNPSADKLEALEQQFAVHTTQDNKVLAQEVDVLIVAVKPHIVPVVLNEIASVVRARTPLVVSVATGIRASDMCRWLGYDAAVVRGMPNTPALVSSGATALYANTRVNEDQRALAESILRAVGITVWVEKESDIDAVTAVSGSGPAYFFFMMETMSHAAKQYGLPDAMVRLLVVQTALGAARIALESDQPISALRAMVTSPGGTTEQAINTLKEGRFDEILFKAMDAAKSRAVALADEWGGYECS